MPPYVTLSVDPATFAADVVALLKGSPLAAEFQGGKVNVTSWDFHGLLLLVQAACASVEIVKTNILVQADPTGALGLKFTPDLAAHTAVGLACDLVQFGGPAGWLLNRIDKPLLNLLVDAVMTGFKGRNWLADAKAFLKLG